MDNDSLLTKAKNAAQRAADDLFNDSFAPQMVFFTDDTKPRAIIMPSIGPGTSRAPLAWTTKVLAAGIDNLSEIVWLMDSWQTTQPTKKDGSQWERDEMQYAVTHQTENAELVFECLSLNIIDAAGVIGACNVKYTREADKVVFDWDHATIHIEDQGDDGPKSTGNFPEMLREAIAQPKIRELLLATHPVVNPLMQELEFSVERQRMHTLVATLRHIFQNIKILPILVPTYSDVEAEILQGAKLGEDVQILNEQAIDEITTLEDLFETS